MCHLGDKLISKSIWSLNNLDLGYGIFVIHVKNNIDIVTILKLIKLHK